MKSSGHRSSFILAAFAFLVLGIGYACFIFFFQSPTARVTILYDHGRLPASFEEPIQSQVLQVDCHFDHKQHIVHSAKVQLNIACPDIVGKKLSLVNVSNGFTASVFENSKGVTTDLISLASGANEIKVRAQGVDKKMKINFL